MLIGILADSHDRMDYLRAAVRLCDEHGVEAAVHAGDFIAPFAVEALGELDCPVHAVFGNNDGERLGIQAAFGDWGKVHPGPVELDLGGRRVLLMHEPYALASHEASGRHDLIVYGHTHEIDWRPARPETGRTLVINPGEICGWLSGRGTFALYDLAAGAGRLLRLPDGEELQPDAG